MSSLAVHNLTKRLGEHLAVNDVSFEVPKGEFFVMLGASGSGKSTLLRLISGLEAPESGSVWIAGQDVTALPPRERNIGMVFQDYGLYPNMNAAQNIAYGLEARRVPAAEVKERVQTAAAALDITSLLDRSIVDLSGGEQQRVALARALAKDADVYLFDEPLSNLDPKLRYQARRNIMTLHRLKTMPGVYVTHDQTEAFAMADRIGIMANGQLHQIGTTEALLERPADLTVARFVGSPPMNLIVGQVQTAGDALHFVADGLRFALPATQRAAVERYGRQQLTLGFRPEHVLLAESAAAREAGQVESFSGVIEAVEMLIAETVVSLRLGEGTQVVALIEDDGELELVEGEMLTLAVEPVRVCLFDPGSERLVGG